MLHFRKKVEFLGAWYASYIKVWLDLLCFLCFGRLPLMRTYFRNFTAFVYSIRVDYMALAVDFSSASYGYGVSFRCYRKRSVEKIKIDSTHSPPQIQFERLPSEQTQRRVRRQM